MYVDLVTVKLTMTLSVQNAIQLRRNVWREIILHHFTMHIAYCGVIVKIIKATTTIRDMDLWDMQLVELLKLMPG